MRTPFTYRGQEYEVDANGIIWRDGNPVGPSAQADVQMLAAAAQAQAAATGATTTTTAAPASTTAPPAPAPTTPPPSGGLSAPATVHQTGPDSLVPPTTSSTLPATPPRAGVGSATELRKQRDAIQKQIDALLAKQGTADGLTGPETTLLASLNTRVSGLTSEITDAEKVPTKKPLGTATPDDKYQLFDNGDGTVSSVQNPTWNGKEGKSTVGSIGNHVYVVNSAGDVTVAYTDKDAQQLASAQTAVAQSNAAVAAAAQATNDFTQRAQVDLATRVSNGEDAASIRAEQALELQRLHQIWVEADGDARRKQQELTDYETSRHNQATETLSASQVQATREVAQLQDATTRRGQDISAGSSKYATDSAARTAKMQAGNTLLQNALSILTNINDKLPPGSDLAGKALEGMLMYGQKFLEGMAGAEPTAPDLTNGVKPPGTPTDLTDNVDRPLTPTSPAMTTPDWQRGDQTTAPAQSNGLALPGATGTVAPGAPNYLGTPPLTDFPQFPLGSSDAAAAMAAANAARHNQNMAAPVRLAPDGTPYAGPDDVARVFGRGGPA